MLAYGDLKRVELSRRSRTSRSCCLMDEPTSGMAAAERAS